MTDQPDPNAEGTPFWLLGTWRLLRADSPLDFAPGVRMEFRDDGVLDYHIDMAGRDQVVSLIYRVEGEVLHTENPQSPHTMNVHFSRGAGDVLVLDFTGPKAWLIREQANGIT